MAHVTVSDIKTLMNISTSGFDAIIQQKIDYADTFISHTVSCDTSGNIQEWEYMNGTDIISANCKCHDISVTSITFYDCNDVATVATTADYYKYGAGMWKLKSSSSIPTPVRCRILYTSSDTYNALQEIEKEIVMFEFMKLPIKDNFVAMASKSLGDVSNVTYKTDEEFYDAMQKKLDYIFLRF